MRCYNSLLITKLRNTNVHVSIFGHEIEPFLIICNSYSFASLTCTAYNVYIIMMFEHQKDKVVGIHIFALMTNVHDVIW